MSADPAAYTLRQIEARAHLTRTHLRGFIKRGDLHIEHLPGRPYRVSAAEAEAFVRFVEAVRSAAPHPGRSRGSYCQDVPGNRCACSCHLRRRGRQKRPPARWNTWLPSHDATLLEMVEEGLSPEKISEQLTARGPVPRTVASVRIRINKLGRSTRDGWMSGEELIRELGVYRARVAWFEAQGLLTRAQWGRWRRYAIAEVEALIGSQAGLTIDPRRVKDARLRALAETAAIVNRRRAAG